MKPFNLMFCSLILVGCVERDKAQDDKIVADALKELTKVEYNVKLENNVVRASGNWLYFSIDSDSLFTFNLFRHNEINYYFTIHYVQKQLIGLNRTKRCAIEYDGQRKIFRTEEVSAEIKDGKAREGAAFSISFEVLKSMSNAKDASISVYGGKDTLLVYFKKGNLDFLKKFVDDFPPGESASGY